jgi:hypothetical protein
MTDQNPYLKSSHHLRRSQQPSPRFHWRSKVLFVASIVASIPYYGFFVHGSRDSQNMAILIGLCWLASVVFAIGSVFLSLYRPPTSRASMILTVYLFIAVIIGWGGTRNAALELLAG